MRVTAICMVLGAIIAAVLGVDAGAVGRVLLAFFGAVAGAVLSLPVLLFRSLVRAPRANGALTEREAPSDEKIGVPPGDRWRYGAMQPIVHPTDLTSRGGDGL